MSQPRSQHTSTNDTPRAEQQLVGSAGAVVLIRPSIGLAAVERKLGGAWRVWTAGRTLDRRGSGWVEAYALSAFLDSLGVHERSRQRWIEQAVDAGLFRDVVKRRDGTIRYLLAGEPVVAHLLGCQHVDPRYYAVDAAALFHKGWRSTVWQGYLAANHEERVISRAALQGVSAVERHRQARYERSAGVARTQNFVPTGRPADHAAGLREQGWNAYALKGQAIVRLPDSRATGQRDRLGGRGRARKTNAALSKLTEAASSTLGSGPGRRAGERPVRVFFYDDKKAERAMRRYGREDRNVAGVFACGGKVADGSARLWQWIGK